MSATKNDIIGAQENFAPLIDTETQNSSAKLSARDAFLAKTVHPPSAVPGYEGIPTNDCRSQVITEWVDNRLINTSKVGGGGLFTTVPNGEIEGYAFLHTSAPNFPIMVFVKVGPGTIWPNGGWRQDIGNTKKLTIYDMNNFWRDATLYRQCYKSYTYYANTTAFNDVGEVSTAQFNPAVQFTAAAPASVNKPAFFEALLAHGGVLLDSDDWSNDTLLKYSEFVVGKEMLVALMRDNSKVDVQKLTKEQQKQLTADRTAVAAFREVTSKSVTKMQQARVDRAFNAKYEEGDEFIKPICDNNIVRNFKITPDMEYQIVNFGAMGNNQSGNSDGAVVPSMEQVTSLSKRAFTCPAKEGQFVVNRLNKAVPSWYATSHNKQLTSPYGLYECWYSFNDDLGNDNYKPFEFIQAGATAPSTCMDAFWGDDWTWSWTVFDGMVPNTNIATSSVSNQILQIKGYNGYEIQPAAKSPWAGLQSLGPLPDVMAIQEYERSTSKMKDGTISANNFLGAIAKGALQVGKFLLPSLIGAAKTKVATAKPAKKMRPVKTMVFTARSRKPIVREPPPPRRRSRSRSKSASRNMQQQYVPPPQPPRPRSQSRGRQQQQRSQHSHKINRELDNIQHQVKSMTFNNRRYNNY
nr:hypothetical protein [Hepelivirales sp.]WAY16448.1 hypothetical protein [Hepelivirales sp.]